MSYNDYKIESTCEEVKVAPALITSAEAARSSAPANNNTYHIQEV